MALDYIFSQIIRSSMINLEKAFLCWEELAKDRKTVAFTPSNQDSVYISKIFEDHRIKTGIITHDMIKKIESRY